ncbi:MAG: M56 family metallopeptidase [Faecousia sp.]
MIDWILSSSLLILVVICTRAIFKDKISQRLRYALWSLVLLRLLIPVNIGHSVISTANLSASIQTRQTVASLENRVQNQNGTTPSVQVAVRPDNGEAAQQAPVDRMETEPSEERSFRREWIPEIAKTIWIVGAVSVGGVFLYSNLRFGARLKRSSRRIRGIRRGLPIRISEAADSPCLFGLFHPTIFVTQEVADNPTLLRHCVCHERCHYRHGDHVWAALRGVCVALHWYNPLVWWAASLSRQDSELACDEAAIAMLGERERAEYGRTLILMTAQKNRNVLLAATTMSAKKSVIRERIRMIARKPKTAALTMIVLILVGVIAAGCVFTGAKETPTEDTDTSTVQTESGNTEDTAGVPDGQTDPDAAEQGDPAATVAREVLHNERERDKVCIAVLPTGISMSGENFRYIIPEDQERCISAYQNAVGKASEGYEWDGSRGWYIYYEDEWWEVTESGALLGVGSVSPENAAELVALCQSAIADAGMNSPARPEDFTAIRSATLDWNGTHTISNQADLSKIGNWLTNSREIRGAGCWFTGMLTLELESGEVRTIAMATDSCGTWMSEGVIYQYASGNEEFYSMFAAEAIHDAVQQGIDNARDLMVYLDWSRYAREYGREETLALMDMLKDWALEAPSERCFSMANMTRGLDGAYTDYFAWILSQLYEADKPEFAWQCLGNATDAVREEVLRLLAYQWGMSTEEVRATLRRDIDAL